MNIKDIAKKANVSVATVSRVLNHPEAVAKTTKERVMAVIEEAGFQPNWFAKALNHNKTYTIGTIVPNILDPAYTEIAKGIEDIALQKGYITFICNSEKNLAKEKKYLDAMVMRKVDGLVLVYSAMGQDDLKELIDKKIPVVMIGENKGASDISKVKVDCFEGAYKGVKHLTDMGYESIGIIYGETPEQENHLKLDGYRQRLRDAGIKINKEYIVQTKNNIDGGYIGAKKLLNLSNPPRAIFASSDLLAVGAIDAAGEMNVSIPKELSIIGFDDINMASYINPRLTTVVKPLHRMGLVGARLLFDIIEDESGVSQTREIILQSKMKIRMSCGHRDRIEEMF